jgi:chromosome segregation ATPase
MMEKRALELEKLEHMYDDASFSSSNRQIELVARESELEKLANDISVLRGQRKEADKRHQEVVAEGKTTRDALKAEKKRTADLEKKLERLLATLADREDKLDRREKDLARLRERLKGEAGGGAAAAGLAGVQDNVPARNDEVDKVLAKLEGDRERLETRLTTLARENKRLKTELGAAGTAKPINGNDAGDALREQMNTLAAEVVSLTAKLEGPDSPIAKALAAPQEARSGTVSLADRVRALQRADLPS